MTELKPRIHDECNGLDYVLVGDYYGAPVLRGGLRRYRPHPGTSALRLCGAGACRHRQKAPDPAGAAPAVP